MIDRPRGLATGELNRLLPHPFKSAGTLGTVLAKMEEEGLLTRSLNGKRCYEIVLGDLPAETAEQVAMLTQLFERQDAHKEQSCEEVKAPEADDALPQAEKITRGLNVAGDYSALAKALLVQVAEIVSRPDRVAEAQNRLDQALAEIERLRERCRIITERAGELEQENRALRSSVESLGDTANEEDRSGIVFYDSVTEARIDSFARSQGFE